MGLALKLECLQVTGSFKPRGALNKVLGLPPEARARGLVTASGGNHGLGVAFAGWVVGAPVTVVLPEHAPASKARALEGWGARVVTEGAAWDDANVKALALSERDGLAYVHAFADPEVIAGQGTLGLEILEDLPDVDALVVAIGGGGLMAGVAIAAKALRPELRLIGVEPVGAPTLKASLAAGRVVELEKIETAAGTLAPRRSAELNFRIIQELVDDVVLVDDAAMRDAARWLWRECSVAAELSGAASVAAVRLDLLGPGVTRPCAVVCGAGTDGIPEGS